MMALRTRMRRLLPLGVILTLLSSSAGLFVPAEGGHGCTDHVCVCRAAARAAEPAPTPQPAACHGPAGPMGRTFTLQASCNHDQDGGLPGFSGRPALLPPSPSPMATAQAPLPPLESSAPLARLSAPETPPPRLLAS
jgi:hypothetical protein